MDSLKKQPPASDSLSTGDRVTEVTIHIRAMPKELGSDAKPANVFGV